MSEHATSPAGRRILVLGGTSEIAIAIVRELQRRLPRQVALAGRDLAALEQAAQGLRADGCDPVITVEVDALRTDEHERAIADAVDRLGGADIVIVAVGVLGERGGLPTDIPAAVELLQANTAGAGSMLMHCAARLRNDGGGTVIVLSSVAAERPRRANAVYGASKAGLDSLAQGLGDELGEEGVRMLVVRPGFVKTRMTEGLDAAPFATTPEAVATVTADALDGSAHTVWAPGIMRWVMLVMRLMPRSIFRRIKQ